MLAICSTEFLGLVQAQARAVGFPDFPTVVIPHPLSPRTPQEVREMAERCAEEIARFAAENGD